VGVSLLLAYDQLDLVAEISVALLGFVAIFLALSKTDGRFSASDRHFVQALVVSSALAIVLALAPRSIGLFIADVSVWYVASMLALVLGSLTMFLQLWQQLRMTPDEAVQIHWLWHVIAWILGICVGILFIFGLFDSVRIVAFYVGGVSLMVPLCLWVFIGVVFRRFF